VIPNVVIPVVIPVGVSLCATTSSHEPP